MNAATLKVWHDCFKNTSGEWISDAFGSGNIDAEDVREYVIDMYSDLRCGQYPNNGDVDWRDLAYALEDVREGFSPTGRGAHGLTR